MKSTSIDTNNSTNSTTSTNNAPVVTQSVNKVVLPSRIKDRDTAHLDILSIKHKQFVHHYVYTCGNNGSEAARKAGYTAKNISKCGNELKKIPKVLHAIKKETEYLLLSLDMSKDEIVAGFASFAYNEDVRVADRLRALEALAKINGCMKPESNVQVAVFSDADKLRSDIIAKHVN